MGYIILRSTNDKLSYVIKKNPSTAPHIKQIKKGYCIGWFHENSNHTPEIKTETKTDDKAQQNLDSVYVMRFLDTGENVSFPKNDHNDYDYLPYMQYCAPVLITVVTKEMLSTVLNQGSPDDAPNKCSIEQAVVKLSNRAVKIIEKLNTFVPKYKIVLKPTQVSGMYNMMVSSDNSSISDLLQYIYLLGYTLNCLTFTYTDRPADSGLDKIIKIMNKLEIPYYIRYTLKINMIGRREFERVKKELEGGKDYKDYMKMTFGNTQSQRFDFISKNVLNFCRKSIDEKKNVHIVDIGCGEGYYVRNLLNSLKSNKIDVTYHAHDIDSSEMDKIDKLIESDELYSSVIVHRTFEDLLDRVKTIRTKDMSATVLVVFSEVIEHIPLDKIEEFMIKLLSELDFETMLITTPREEFNTNYLLAKGEFRHDDHKQEFTKEEFVNFIDSIKKKVAKKTFESAFEDVGDVVNGIGMSQAIILKKT